MDTVQLVQLPNEVFGRLLPRSGIEGLKQRPTQEIGPIRTGDVQISLIDVEDPQIRGEQQIGIGRSRKRGRQIGDRRALCQKFSQATPQSNRA